MAAVKCLLPLLGLLILLARLIKAAPQAEGIVQLEARDTIPPPPAITIGGYHYVPGIDIDVESLTVPPPPAIETMIKDPVNPRKLDDSDNDASFTAPPPPTIQNGGLHFAPVPPAPSSTDAFTAPPATLMTTMLDRPSITNTGMGQLITPHVPVLTVGPLPLSSSFVPSASGVSFAAQISSHQTTPSSRSQFEKRQILVSSLSPVPPIKTAPFSSLSRPNICCSTFYTPTTVTACYTTLSSLGAPVTPITVNDQSVIFSSKYGYELAPTSNSVETLTTFFVAPLHDLHPGIKPTGKVLAVVCKSRRVGCTSESEFWQVTVKEMYSVSVTTIASEATLTGPTNAVAGDSTNIAVAGTKTSAVTFSKMVKTTRPDTGLGLRQGVTVATESSRDITSATATVLQATTRTVTFPRTSATGFLNV
ncbi:hypothetical protein N7G274_004093 [Stereocaulon virgatum]|uniref:Uncharacterized protein n=1 Tax=Stereocaulon virgatum TaxID=373712 RepID=A0ABR4AAX8_9LECA